MTIRRPLTLIGGLLRLLPQGDRLPGADIGARVYRTSNQSIANGTNAAISFTNARHNTDLIWSSSQPTVLTCRTAGKYLIGGCFRFEYNGAGNRFLAVLLNSSTQIVAAESTGASTISTASCIHSLAVNDYVQMTAFQNSGQSLNVLYEPSFSPEFYMQLLP